MLAFLADENPAKVIVTLLRGERPDIDIVRVQEVGLRGVDDQALLDWAARNNRLVVTRDVKTITRFAYDRVREGKPMPGVVEVGRKMSYREAVEELILLADGSYEDEWQGQVIYLPLKTLT